MKKTVTAILMAMILICALSLCVFADNEGEATLNLWSWVKTVNGNLVALFGAFLAVFMTGWGSAKGVGLAGKTAAGVVAEDPSLSGKMILLEALPATQGIYGFIAAFLILLKTGVIGDPVTLSTADGFYYLIACLPIAIVGFISAQHQAKVSAAGMQMVAKQKDKNASAITYAALVETYAILALLISALLILLK